MARSKAQSATLLLACALALSAGCEKKAADPQVDPAAAKPGTAETAAAATAKAAAPIGKPDVTAPAKLDEVGTAKLAWRTDEAAAIAESKASKRPLFVDVSAKWCAPCVDLDNKTFTDPELARILETQFVPLKLDVTEQTDEHKKLQEKYGAPMLPMLVVVAPDGKELLRLDGFLGPDELRAKLASLPKS